MSWCQPQQLPIRRTGDAFSRLFGRWQGLPILGLEDHWFAARLSGAGMNQQLPFCWAPSCVANKPVPREPRCSWNTKSPPAAPRPGEVQLQDGSRGVREGWVLPAARETKRVWELVGSQHPGSVL